MLDMQKQIEDLVAYVREEGGTPAIVESIRAGLVFQLKLAVGAAEIRRREESFIRRAVERWRRHPNLEILGNLDLGIAPWHLAYLLIFFAIGLIVADRSLARRLAS